MSIMNHIISAVASMMENGDTKRLATQEVTSGIFKESDIVYLNDGNKYHLLDIYYPENTQNLLPVIIDIHGGGLFYGDKELNRNYARYLASFGYTVVMPSYRLVPDVLFEHQVYDVFACYKWVDEHINEHHGDKEHLFVVGDSAGGLLAAYTALVNCNDNLCNIYNVSKSLDIKALGLISGMFEPKNGIFRLFGKAFFGENYKNNQVYKNVDFKELQGLEKLPASYLVSSEQDFIKAHTLNFDKLLTKNNVEHMLHFWDKPVQKSHKLEHVFSVLYPLYSESVQTTAELIEWFKSHDTIHIKD